MADKMMRISGRDSVGKARAISVDKDGVLGNSTKRVHENLTINAGESIIVTENTELFSSTRVSINGAFTNNIKLEYSTSENEGLLFNRDRAYLSDTISNLAESDRGFYSQDLPVFDKYIGIRITNLTDETISIRYLTLTLSNSDFTKANRNEIHSFKTTSSVDFSTKGAKTLVVYHKNNNSDGNTEQIYRENQSTFLLKAKIDEEYVNVPFVDSNRMMIRSHLYKNGVYYADISQFDSVRLELRDTRLNAELLVVLSDGDMPQPLDAPVRYKRIDADSEDVYGNIRAIIPLTDLEMGVNTLLVDEVGETGNAVFQDYDSVPAGLTIFGPFRQVRLRSGVALLVMQ